MIDCKVENFVLGGENAIIRKRLKPAHWVLMGSHADVIAAAASEPEASEQGSNPNLYMGVKISILF